MPKLMIIAAEASSVHYALNVMRELRSFDSKFEFFGVGSTAMEKEGFTRLGKSEDMAVVGLVEVAKHYRRLKTIFDNLIEAARVEKPQAVLLLDYPDFNLRLGKVLKEQNIRIFYYISPQVWAWRQNRIHQIKAICECVFLIFPFEVDFYRRFDVPHEFVGHPLLDDLKDDYFSDASLMLRRQKFGILPKEKILLLMPGSRFSEIEKLFQFQLEVATKIVQKNQNVRIAIACAPSLRREDLTDRMDHFKLPYIFLHEDPNSMIAMGDVVLAASGTATLMVGLLQKPMVIIYKVAWLTGIIGGWLARHLKYFGLPNLVLDKKVVLELKQDEVQIKTVVQELEKLLFDEIARSKCIQELAQLKNHLGGRGANKCVAQFLWNRVYK